MKTSDTDFEVDLTFNDIRERLKVPFAAIQAFFDPSVKFGLQFDPDPAQLAQAELENEEQDVADALQVVADETKAPAKKMSAKNAETPGEVVSLDAFRKKK